MHKTTPAIINGNKQDMEYLSYSLKNYVPTEWNPIDTCLSCRNNLISLKGEKVNENLSSVFPPNQLT